jgi:hypothetical protein
VFLSKASASCTSCLVGAALSGASSHRLGSVPLRSFVSINLAMFSYPPNLLNHASDNLVSEHQGSASAMNSITDFGTREETVKAMIVEVWRCLDAIEELLRSLQPSKASLKTQEDTVIEFLRFDSTGEWNPKEQARRVRHLLPPRRRSIVVPSASRR